MFERGKIVLVPFPFTDLSSAKVRPAVIISAPKYAGSDVSVVFISSRITEKIGSTDHVMRLTDSTSEETGLKVDSVIKCHKVATLDKKIVLGEIGFLPPKELKKVDQKLRLALGL